MTASSARRAQTVPGTNAGSYAPHMTGEASDVTLDGPAVPGVDSALGEGWISVRDLANGNVVVVDGEARTVAAAGPVNDSGGNEVGVDFESYDREPDGSPSGYLYRTFGVDEHFRTPVPDEAIAEVTEFANDYCSRARGARPGTCYPISWNIRDQYGWDIVKGRRDDRPHYWNAMPDGRYFDGTAAQFDGETGPLVAYADDSRYEAQETITAIEDAKARSES